ncbi:MAG: 2-amino-4-hydroxy-6-hydroxymethyldihydropteridine pyrophosphokinae [Evtepia sp.]|nr:2-amino-4-hydroxy-6-hydroxymethyldihydropteridine pyrophosphokinae [Evtepia sp.]
MDQIKISGIEFYAYHGVLDTEKQQGQFFRVDCEFTLDTSVCDDEISHTVNYGELAAEVVQFSQKHNYHLIETLANELAQHLLLKYKDINEIVLTVHKPHAPISVSFSDVSITIKRGWKTCYLGIGSNLGNREENLDLVSVEIAKDPHLIELSKSSYVETKPYGVTDQPEFLNGAMKVKTTYTAKKLLAFCKKTEALSGRVKTRPWGERTLDIDILMFANEVIFTPELMIPHPEMHFRGFVLKPLCEIEPYLIHPIQRMNVQSMLKQLTDDGMVERT